jgi:nitrogen fixation protein NifU and related proteins
MYTDKLMDHFQNPRNVGTLRGADGIGVIGDPDCGDYLRIYIKVSEDCLKEIKFEVFGCPAAIATTSVLTEVAKGKKIAEVFKITDQDIADALGGLPDAKMHCSNLGTVALYFAIMDYFSRTSPENPEKALEAALKR